MDISSVNSDLIRGNVTTIILGSLWSADRYGYDILKEIESKSDGQYSLKQATLYNQLKRLEKQGLISSYDGDPDDTGGGKRKYYALTAEGRAYLKKEKSEYEYSRTILDKLVSSQEFDFTNPIPFDAAELRPYSKKATEDKPKVVYKDKIVEKVVRYDRFGNEISEQDVEKLAEQARLEEEEEARRIQRLEDEAKSREEQYNLELKRRQEQFEESLKTQRAYFDSQIKEKLALQNASHQQQLGRLNEQNAQLQEAEIQLQQEQEARLAVEYQLQAIEEERQKAEEEARLAAERKRQEQAKPSLTLEEMFAKLDAESEYKSQQEQEQRFVVDEPTQQTEQKPQFNAYGGDFYSASSSQTSLKDMFRQLDDKEAEIDKQRAEEYAALEAYEQQKLAENEAASDKLVSEIESTNSVYTSPSSDTYATSAVVKRPEETFEYENGNVNYHEFFYSISEQEKERENDSEQAQHISDVGDIKTRLYTKGFKVRPYDRGNTSEYYTFNFILSNRIRRDTFLIILAFFVAEVAIMWASLANQISYKYFLPILIVGAVLCFVPTVVYLVNPARRIRANFNFKLSLLNRAMVWIELTVVCILIGFFGVGASINDINSILMSIVLPAVLLTNFPLSSLIYFLLYRTRKYHIA